MAARYGFLHALYQDVFYGRLTARQQRRLHQQLGERVEQAYGKRAREIAAELALHFERGRDYRRAVQYLEHAGENAIRRSAHQEAISLLIRGLELLKTLPDTPERAQQELALQIALAPLLGMTKGLAAPEVEKVYVRARELCQQVGETSQLFRALQGLLVFYLMRGAELQTTRELGDQLLTLAQRTQDPAFLLQAHWALGYTLFCLGELAPAQAHLEQSIALSSPKKGLLQYPAIHHVSDLILEALALWLLGYPDQSLKRSQEALDLAAGLSHLFSLANALGYTAWFHLLRREEQVVRERAEAVMTPATEQGFSVWLAWGTILRGWALAAQEQGEKGIVQMRQGLAALRATGGELHRSYHLALLAEVCGKTGQAEEGLNVLTEALATAHKTGERWYEAELYRLKGELLLAQEIKSQKSKVKGQKSKIRKSKS